MSFFKSNFLVSVLILITTACGVKGDPQPPLTPPLLGRGEPSFSKAIENVKAKKKTKPALDPDWDEPAEFPEESKP